MPPSLRWDIFCRVVDNFGDAGVCWRLARQLAREHGNRGDAVDRRPREPRAARPGARAATAPTRPSDGIRVRRLDARSPASSRSPDVVIEAFGCGLPDALRRTRMARGRGRRCWIVLEYLTAEPWIDASTRCLRRTRACRSRASSGFRASRRRPAACCAKRICSTRATRSQPTRARGGVLARARATRRRAGRRCTVSLFCYANRRAARAARRVGRRRRARRLPGSGRRRALGARRAGPAAPCRIRGATAAARPAHARRRAVRRPGRVRPAAVGVRPQLRARRGLLRARAMGGAALRLARLPAGRRRALAKLDAFLDRGSRAASPDSGCARRSARSGTRGTRATPPPPRDAWPALPGRACPGSASSPGAWARGARAASSDLAEELVEFCESR